MQIVHLVTKFSPRLQTFACQPVTSFLQIKHAPWRPRCLVPGMDDNALSIEARILSIIRDECSDPDRTIHREDPLYDLLDSLGKVEVVMALEDEFEMAVPDSDVEGIKTVGDLIDYIARHARAIAGVAADARSDDAAA